MLTVECLDSQILSTKYRDEYREVYPIRRMKVKRKTWLGGRMSVTKWHGISSKGELLMLNVGEILLIRCQPRPIQNHTLQSVEITHARSRRSIENATRSFRVQAGLAELCNSCCLLLLKAQVTPSEDVRPPESNFCR